MKLAREVWKDIPGYEGLYAVSDLGRVKSLDRSVWGGGFLRRRRGFIKAAKVRNKGYLEVTLSKEGVGKCYLVHTLVLLAFVGPCPEGMECRHFPNRDPADNRVQNLSWGTRAQNHRDQDFHGTRVRGELVGTSKLTNDKVRLARALSIKGWSQVRIADTLGVTHRVIGRILVGKCWRHVK